MAMKNLKDVLEKLKVDDIVLGEKFPIDGTLDDISNFLKENNFKEIKMSATWELVQRNFLKESCPVFTESIKNNFGVIAIYDGASSTQKDLFIITNYGNMEYYIFYNLDTKKFIDTKEAKKVTKEKFLKEISNIF